MTRAENSWRTLVENLAYLQSTKSVGVFLQCSSPHRFAYLSSELRVHRLQQIGDVMTVSGDQDFAPWSEKFLDSRPVIGDQTRSSARSFEDPGGGEKPTLAIDSRLMFKTMRAEQLMRL